MMSHVIFAIFGLFGPVQGPFVTFDFNAFGVNHLPVEFAPSILEHRFIVAFLQGLLSQVSIGERAVCQHIEEPVGTIAGVCVRDDGLFALLIADHEYAWIVGGGGVAHDQGQGMGTEVSFDHVQPAGAVGIEAGNVEAHNGAGHIAQVSGSAQIVLANRAAAAGLAIGLLAEVVNKEQRQVGILGEIRQEVEQIAEVFDVVFSLADDGREGVYYQHIGLEVIAHIYELILV